MLADCSCRSLGMADYHDKDSLFPIFPENKAFLFVALKGNSVSPRDRRSWGRAFWPGRKFLILRSHRMQCGRNFCFLFEKYIYKVYEYD